LHQIRLLYGLWLKHNNDAKLQVQNKATTSLAYDEDTQACTNRLNKLKISTASFWGDHHLNYFTQGNPNNCVGCGALASIS